ncbi:ribonuclease R [Catenovulum sp. 2E275]|uniref:ribonuclease R n=1 Tax=Catenovulum sp. 2E275 TaxID=2980497 RepID=UPI0021D0BAB3|nr:ribonuclease R [Catenovulum sp. 2E275]MCU4675420.1 ribonuclease R [Catenovulum sp. 2E275]
MKSTNHNTSLKFHPLLAEKLVSYVETQLQAVSYLSLCDKLNIHGIDAEQELQACLTALEQEGRVVRNKNNDYATPEMLGLYVGKVIGHKDGYGFLQLPKGTKDLFIPVHQMDSLLHGDLILVKQSGTDSRGRKECRLVRVLQTRTEPFVGRCFIEHGIAYVMPDDSRISQEIIIPSEHKNGARNGQMVVAQLLTRPSKRVNATAKITEVLGEHMAPGMEIEVALRNYDIPHQWPNKVDKELSRISDEVPENAKLNRVDLRNLPLVTIDGEDARDFDDAVYCETKKSGGWRLWVAIADVSYYVRPGTALDEQAQLRGTSVYFPEQVVPMLPEKLSNGLCSLNPQVDRLCMVCEMTVSANGRLSGYQFYQAVMNSHARLTYNKVHAILKGDEKLRERYQHLIPHLENLNNMYASLKQARMARGAIEFDTLEPKFIFNAQRKIESVEIVQRNDAHKIIEECMILANVAAAQFISKHKAQALYRVHDTPDSEKLTQFIGFLAELGITFTLDGEIEPIDFKHLVDKIEGRPDQELIQTMLLRSMKQAAYSPDNVGHFGLALNNYAHFTSPIRRYPDLILHRAIKAILLKQNLIANNSGEYTYDPKEMDELGEHTSMTERRAETATRDVANWLKCEFMQDRLGDEFDGVISAVTSFGFFVRINDLFVEGLVHVSSLQSDFYIYDPIKHRLIGEQKRKVYKLGDEVNIKVISVNLDDKKIDFILTDSESNQKSDKAHRGAAKKYSKSKAKTQAAEPNTKSRAKGSKTQQLMAQDKSENASANNKKSKASSKKRKAKAGKKAAVKANKSKRR